MNDYPKFRYGVGRKYPSIEIWKPRVMQNMRAVLPGRRLVYTFDPTSADIGWTKDYDRCERRCSKIAARFGMTSNFDMKGNRTYA